MRSLRSQRKNLFRMPRRPLMLFFLVSGILGGLGTAQNAETRKFHIDSQRVQGTLEKLSKFGRTLDGGVTRLGYSHTDPAAREYVVGLMKQAGLEVRTDAAGNLFARRGGTESLPVLLFGSHLIQS